MRDLFHEAPASRRATRKAVRRAQELREARDAEERRRAAEAWSTADGYRRLCCVVDALGSKLAWHPDGPGSDALAEAFHRAVRMLCEVEDALGIHGGAKTPPGLAVSRFSPFPDPEPEAAEAERVRTEAQMLTYVRTGLAEAPPPPEYRNEEEARANEPQEELV